MISQHLFRALVAQGLGWLSIGDLADLGPLAVCLLRTKGRA